MACKFRDHPVAVHGDTAPRRTFGPSTLAAYTFARRKSGPDEPHEPAVDWFKPLESSIFSAEGRTSRRSIPIGTGSAVSFNAFYPKCSVLDTAKSLALAALRIKPSAFREV